MIDPDASADVMAYGLALDRLCAAIPARLQDWRPCTLPRLIRRALALREAERNLA